MFEKAVLIFCILLGQSAAGQEPVDSEEPHGLLGQRYVSGQLRIQQPPKHHQSLYDLDATSTFNMNLPVAWTEKNVAAFSQDVFFSMSDLNPFRNEKAVATVRSVGDNIGSFMEIEALPDPLTGAKIDPRYDTPISRRRSIPEVQYVSLGKFQAQQFQIGTTLHSALRDDVRPFLQIGYAYTRFRQHELGFAYVSAPTGENIVAGPSSKIVGFDDHRVISNAGIEWDLNDRLTLRPQIDVDTRYFRAGSQCSAQLIWWFRNDWFLSPGLACNIDGTHPSGLVNVGLSF